MKIDKGTLQKKIREAFPTPQNPTGSQVQQPKVPSQPHIEDMKKRVTDLETLKNRFDKLGFSDEVSEIFNAGKEYTNDNEFYEDAIDNLMYKSFHLTYFTPKEGIEAISQMSPAKIEELSFDSNLKSIVNQIKLATGKSKLGSVNPLEQVYINLQNYTRNAVNEEILKSPVFNMIVESEPARITKGEVLEFLNRK